MELKKYPCFSPLNKMSVINSEMSLIVSKYRRGFKFQCPISKAFYGPYFKTLDAIDHFYEWYDGDVRYIGTRMSDSKQWAELIQDWFCTDLGSCHKEDVVSDSSTTRRKTALAKTVVLIADPASSEVTVDS